MLPGSKVTANDVLMEMSNPQVEQAAVDAKLQLRAAEAQLQSSYIDTVQYVHLCFRDLFDFGLIALVEASLHRESDTEEAESA